MQIYIHRDNQQLGPFTEAEIKAQLASGATSLQDHVWWEGQANWVPLGQSPLAATLSPASPGSAPTVPTAPLQPTPGPSVPAPAKEKTSGLAIASLICSILGLVCGLLSIAGIVCGHMSRSEIKKNPSLQGSGLALSGLIIGYVWLPIYVCIFSISFLVALGNQVKPIFQTINSQLNAAEATNSADQSATNSDQTTNAPDQSTPTPAPTTSPDQSTNSAPAATTTPDQSTNSAPAATTSPDQSTNSTDSSTNTPAPTTNAPASSTNAAPMSQ